MFFTVTNNTEYMKNPVELTVVNNFSYLHDFLR